MKRKGKGTEQGTKTGMKQERNRKETGKQQESNRKATGGTEGATVYIHGRFDGIFFDGSATKQWRFHQQFGSDLWGNTSFFTPFY